MNYTQFAKELRAYEDQSKEAEDNASYFDSMKDLGIEVSKW